MIFLATGEKKIANKRKMRGHLLVAFLLTSAVNADRYDDESTKVRPKGKNKKKKKLEFFFLNF